MSAADFAAQTSDADVMDVSDHTGGMSSSNQTLSGGSPTRALVMTWVIAAILWWAMHFVFKGQLS